MFLREELGTGKRGYISRMPGNCDRSVEMAALGVTAG